MNGNPLTIKELISKLQMVVDDKNMNIGEDDYVFFSLPEDDEGDETALIPIINIYGNHIKFLNGDEKLLNSLINKQGVILSFVDQKI